MLESRSSRLRASFIAAALLGVSAVLLLGGWLGSPPAGAPVQAAVGATVATPPDAAKPTPAGAGAGAALEARTSGEEFLRYAERLRQSDNQYYGTGQLFRLQQYLHS